MDYLFRILDKAISLGATDIHLSYECKPSYRVSRKLIFDDFHEPVNEEKLYEIFEFFTCENPSISDDFLKYKKVDFAYEYSNYRYRFNVSTSFSKPVFSIRVIPAGYLDVDKLGLRQVVETIKKINSGLILITGKVNSGKTTTLNAYIQEVNKLYNKKIVTLEDPVEYIHKSDKCQIIQKEVGISSDISSIEEGLKNLYREDSDICVIGEIRNREMLEFAIDIAESGGIAVGTMHTRSATETIERIINMYDISDQLYIRNTLSTVLKLIISQKLLTDINNNLIVVPEIMLLNSVISAEMRSQKLNINEINDTIHASTAQGCMSFENAFTNLYINNKISNETLMENVDFEKMNLIKNLISRRGGNI